jgi:hypothetical protein
MAVKLHQAIREIAREFVSDARRKKQAEFAIAVRELMGRAKDAGISTAGRTPAFCNAIQTKEFLEDDGLDEGLEIVRVDGPESKLSTTVVVHYRFRGTDDRAARSDGSARVIDRDNDPLMRLRGVLKGAMREGAAAFLHELRRDKENEQAGKGKRVA